MFINVNVVVLFLAVYSSVPTLGAQYSDIKLLTYNLLLAKRFEGYAERKVAILDALKRTDEDIICLQELIHGHDMVQFMNELKKQYPYSLSMIHLDSGAVQTGPSCNANDLLVLKCLQDSCSNAKTEDEELLCAVLNCNVYQAMSQSCLTCAAATGLNITDIYANCITSPYITNTHGLLMLSKRPLSNRKAVDFFPGYVQLRPIGYLQADVDGVGQITCSHLRGGRNQIYEEFNLPFETYYEEIEVEVNRLVSNTCGMEKAVIIGDLNVGPPVSSTSVVGIFSELYKRLLDNGFVSPYVDLDGRCTYCPSNPLAHPWPTSLVIDHVMTKGHVIKKAKRMFDRPEYMSDHFGVEVTIRSTK